ncbi:MAG: type II toxin-antitoxin system RelE/ParE family toxin [Gammaproteobacteria bacterium]|nr:type II toxin-antitoxin system RelE/ParE family toxin [Gammaproteobacteria bacterium]
MIKSFKDKNLEECWKKGKCKKLRADLKRRVLMKLDSIDAATCIDDLQNPPGNKLHQLQGEYKEYWAVSVNGPWRLIFKIQDDNVYDVMLLQYH